MSDDDFDPPDFDLDFDGPLKAPSKAGVITMLVIVAVCIAWVVLT